MERTVGRLNPGVSSSHLTLPFGGQRNDLSEGRSGDQKSCISVSGRPQAPWPALQRQSPFLLLLLLLEVDYYYYWNEFKVCFSFFYCASKGIEINSCEAQPVQAFYSGAGDKEVRCHAH